MAGMAIRGRPVAIQPSWAWPAPGSVGASSSSPRGAWHRGVPSTDGGQAGPPPQGLQPQGHPRRQGPWPPQLRPAPWLNC